MSKRKLPPDNHETFLCPNPMCNSHGFKTIKQLNMHLGQKYDCSVYLLQLRKSLSASVAKTTLLASENNTPTVLQEDNQEMLEGSAAANELPQDFDGMEPILRTNILILMSSKRMTRTKLSSHIEKDCHIQMPVE